MLSFFQRYIREIKTQTPRLEKALKKKRFFGESGFVLLVVPITTFCLGTWQVKRRKWKIELIKSLEEKTQSPPVELPLSLEEISEMEYRPVIVRGEFDHSREMKIGPRSNLLKEGGGLLTTGTGGGFHIITPFKLADREQTILVNRGWVRGDHADPRTRREGQVQGEVEIGGIVRLEEKRYPMTPKGNFRETGYWLYRDLEKMAKTAGTEPIFIDQDLRTSIPGGPLGGQTRISLRNEHFSYIITWYTLSLITFVMWYRRYIRPPPPNTAFDYIRKSLK